MCTLAHRASWLTEMQISLSGPGRAAVPLSTGNHTALCYWSAAEIVQLTAAPPSGQSRIDLIVCQVRDNQLDGGANNDFIFQAIAGAPAVSNPAVPATPANAAQVCSVLVPGAAADLSTATITDLRGGLMPGSEAGRLHAQSAFTFPNGANVKIPFDTTDFLRGGVTANAQGLRVPVGGLYQVDAQLYLQGASNITRTVMTVTKNGASPNVLQCEGPAGVGVGPFIVLQSHSPLQLVAGDTLYGYATVSGGAMNLTAGAHTTFLGLTLLGP